MSKMDRQLNSKKDKETIYEIYRACRLCGAGAGYKMPIIQNVVDIDDSDVELRQKVRECVQIEVHQDDKMPPLICELCVDKVNDFYEFLEMCRQTNKRTRLRLGLPPQSMPKGAPDAGECILGLTEPVYVNDDSDGEPQTKQKKLNPKPKVKKEPELKVKLEKRILIESRSSRLSKRPPTPPRMTRHRTHSKDDNMALSRLKDKSKSAMAKPKSILKKDTKINNEDNSLLTPRLKRSRDKEPVKLETPTKRVKIATRTPQPQTPRSSPKSSPRVVMKPSSKSPISSKSPTSSKSPASSKSPKVSPKRAPSPPRLYKCSVCGQPNKTPQANSSHMRVHSVGFTSPKLACNPCGLWFESADEATSHHKHHRSKSNPYTCKRCTADFKHLSSYDDHFEKNQCIPSEEVPDVKCDVCWHLFPTNNLLDEHRCLGEDHRPGGKCGKCNRSYALLRNLKKHELTCTAKKKGEITVNPVLLKKCKPVQIRVSRCDPLLMNLKQEHYDVSNVTADFGLDKNCTYPYISSVNLRLKSDPDRMVDIKQEIEDDFYAEEDYIHWDSENTESDEEVTCSEVLNSFAKKKNVDTLANLTLKTIFSKKCLGRVPKKKRRVKQEKSMFDSLLNETEDDVTRDINNIIDNLGDDDELDGNDINREVTKDNIVIDTDKSIDESNDIDSKVIDGIDSKNNVDKDTQESQNDKSSVKEKNDDVSLADDNDSSEKNDQNAQSDVKLSDIEKDDISDQVSKQEDENQDSANKNYNSVCNDTEGSNNNLSSNNDNNGDLTPVEDKANNDTVNNTSVENNDIEGVSKNENNSNINDTSPSEVDKDENQNEGTEARNDTGENSQDSNSVGGVSESILNDSTQSDAGSENEKESIDKVNINIINDNATSLPGQNSDIDETKSQTNVFSSENLSLSSKMSALDTKTNVSSQVNEEQSEYKKKNDVQSEDIQKNEEQSKDIQKNEEQSDTQSNDNINESDYKNAISVIVNNSGKSKNSIDSEEMDDSKLMEALDAQIGERNDNLSGQVNDNFNVKIGLEDLMSDKMDSIPEDFNFDA